MLSSYVHNGKQDFACVVGNVHNGKQVCVMGEIVFFCSAMMRF